MAQKVLEVRYSKTTQEFWVYIVNVDGEEVLDYITTDATVAGEVVTDNLHAYLTSLENDDPEEE